jgi:hypothetical protein
MVSVNKPELDISNKAYFAFSPIATRKNFLVTSSSLIRKESEKKSGSTLLNIQIKKPKRKESNNYSKFIRNTEDNDDSFDKFTRGILLI